jgi:hypothetical protein
MAIDFPASPTLNDVFTVGNVTYVWDGTKWTASVTGGISLDKIEEGNTSAEVIDTGSDGRFVVTTEGTERLRVTNTGLVGIGTNSPSVELSIAGSDPNLVIWEGSDGASSSKVQLGTGLVQGFINIHKGDGTRTVQIGSDDTSYFNGGNVGIGTASPVANLQVTATGSVSEVFVNSDVSTSAVASRIALGNNVGTARFTLGLLGGGGETAFLGTEGNFPIYFQTNGTERARIDSSGRVGIGTSSPTSTLHIQHPAQTAAYWEGKGLLIHEDATANKGIALYSRGDNEQYIASLTDDAASYLIIGTRKSSSVNAVDAVTIRGDGKVGIGTTSPRRTLEVSGADGYLCLNATNTSTGTSQLLFGDTDDDNIGRIYYDHGTDNMAFWTNTSEKARIDTSGRLLVGTSSSAAGGSRLQIEGTGYYESSASFRRNSNDASAPALRLNKSRGTSTGSYTAVQNGDVLGLVQFSGSDGTDDETGAQIACEVDGTPGANDMPGRLVFSTTADGASSPTERMRISSTGQTNFYYPTINNYAAFMDATNASFGGTVLGLDCNRAATDSYYFLNCSSGDGGDNEFNLRGGGSGYCDGSWNGGGADYAEYFEWSDSNPNEEDRRGISVVLDGDKIRKAQAGEDPIGVISGNPSMVGDAAWNKWSGKYLRDEFGTYIQEDYEVVNDEGETVVQQRRKLNPDYDSNQEYTPREQRPEWDCVGLMGKLRIRKGQATGSRWIKMRDISDSVEEWLVR